jgi:hypothetical protein
MLKKDGNVNQKSRELKFGKKWSYDSELLASHKIEIENSSELKFGKLLRQKAGTEKAAKKRPLTMRNMKGRN